jgi:hypothetical protein
MDGLAYVPNDLPTFTSSVTTCSACSVGALYASTSPHDVMSCV